MRNLFAQAGGDSSLASLRAASSEEILKLATHKGLGRPPFAPDIDGYFLPQSVPAIFAAGNQAHVPLIAGWNQDEGTSNVVKAPEKGTMEGLRATAVKEFGPRAEEFLKVYHANDDAEALRAAEDFAGDNFLVYSTWAWLEAQVKTGSTRSTGIYSRSPRREIPSIPSLPVPSTPMRLSTSSATLTRARERRSGQRTTSFPS